MIVLASVLLVLCVGAVWWFVRDDVADYAAFKLLSGTEERQRRYRVWILKSFLLFSGLTVVELAIVGRLRALTVLPPEFAGLSRAVRSVVSIHDFPGAGFIVGFVGAVVVGVVGGAVVAGLAAKRKAASARAVVIGDIEALMPRNGVET